MPTAFRFSVLAAVTLATTPAFASGIKTFKDWVAACDNLRNCSAYGFNPDGYGAYLRVERGGAAEAPIRITLSVDPQGAASYRAAFDPALPGLPQGAISGAKEGEGNDYRRTVLIDNASAEPLLASIRSAKAIVVTFQAEPGQKLDTPKLSISMSGAVAALLWIDDQQKRVGTTTAMIKRGDKSASTIPPLPKPPVIVATRPSNETAPAKPPAALANKGRALCGDDDKKSKLDNMYPLGGGQLLYEFSCPDSSGAYNFQSVYMVGPAANPQAAQPVSFKWPIKIGDAAQDGPSNGLINADFNKDTLTLSSFSKGRGIGDCGSVEDWVWDGKTFQLAGVSMMSECNGVPPDDWPTLYKTEIKR